MFIILVRAENDLTQKKVGHVHTFLWGSSTLRVPKEVCNQREKTRSNGLVV